MQFIRTLTRALIVIACVQFTATAQTVLADPPARVARLAYIDGTVSFAPAGQEEWVIAGANRPVVTGDRLWADEGGRTELQIGSAAVRLGATTSVSVLNLDDQMAQFEVAQGTVYVSVRSLAPSESIEIDTPNLALVITRAGVYRIDVDPNGDSTAVSVRSGEANVFGENAAYVIPSGRWYRFYATGLAQRQDAALPVPDEFEQWAAGRDRRRGGIAAARYVAPEVIGYEDLDDNGTWSTVPEYGPVWTPNRVAADWAPYRDGHWSWIDPWGWTWVDAAPWGFAPYHYGRWAYMRDRWSWVPGPRTVRPVYAPALVAFVGDAGFRLTIATGPAAGVAWFPLAPGEVYRPAYRASRDYFTRVNVSNTQVNTTIINNVYNNNTTNIVYRNREAPRGMTAVPSSVFVQSRPVAAATVRMSAADIASVPVTAMAAVAPSRTSVLGAAQPARSKPSNQALARQVVAKTKPPPAPVSFDAREAMLAKQPGRPLDSSPVAPAGEAARADTSKVKVVTSSRRPEPAPKAPESAVPARAQPPAAVAQPQEPARPAESKALPQATRLPEASPAQSARPAEAKQPAQATRLPEASPAQSARPAEAARPPDKGRARETARPPEGSPPANANAAPATTAPANVAPAPAAAAPVPKPDEQASRAAKGRPAEAQPPRPPQTARQPQEPRREEQRAQPSRPPEQARAPAPPAPPAPVAAPQPDKRPAEAKSEPPRKGQDAKKDNKKDDKKDDKRDDEKTPKGN